VRLVQLDIMELDAPQLVRVVANLMVGVMMVKQDKVVYSVMEVSSLFKVNVSSLMLHQFQVFLGLFL